MVGKMGYIKLSSEYSLSSYTLIENLFINEYMPDAHDSCIKVYLYGLFIASCALSEDIDVDKMKKVLHLEVEDIIDAFCYWQELGLVHVNSKSPLEVTYLPVRMSVHAKKYKVGKYDNFSKSLQEIISGRMLNKEELTAYFDFLENHPFEQEALLMVAKYCAILKGNDINYRYVLAVARNWAIEGVTTVRRVEEKLNEQEMLSGDLALVLKKLRINRAADPEERQIFQRLTSGFGFTLPAILHAASKCKRGGFKRLENILSEYYSHRALDVMEMEAFDKNKDYMYTLARSINKLIGVYYEQLDNIIETYISPWVSAGFEDDALRLIADYCFKNNIRTLDGMNAEVEKFKRQGLLTIEVIERHLQVAGTTDKAIKQILELAGLSRNVNSWDRDNYRTWTYSWKLPIDMIEHAAKLSHGKTQPIPYLNRILSDWHDKGITSLNAVQSYKVPDPEKREGRNTREYSKEEWQSMLANLDDIEM